MAAFDICLLAMQIRQKTTSKPWLFLRGFGSTMKTDNGLTRSILLSGLTPPFAALIPSLKALSTPEHDCNTSDPRPLGLLVLDGDEVTR
ncbi:hypothetical protein EOK75_11445 [Pseudorhodobacter turbinis]|uniref:Uncharacterized protein n=1 Tax=Pseudorhodobacter turbinis TaxID=2500533 RepID=A0A4P8EHE1_9RHOB|nr:hypothetical protein EOK75_11445 [Pseudorhodobacter turbinis]